MGTSPAGASGRRSRRSTFALQRCRSSRIGDRLGYNMSARMGIWGVLACMAEMETVSFCILRGCLAWTYDILRRVIRALLLAHLLAVVDTLAAVLRPISNGT